MLVLRLIYLSDAASPTQAPLDDSALSINLLSAANFGLAWRPEVASLTNYRFVLVSEDPLGPNLL